MKVEVQLFARARDAAGAERVTLELPSRASVGDLRTALAASYPKLAPLTPSLFVAVGHAYAGNEAILEQHSEIACFPPVSGG